MRLFVAVTDRDWYQSLHSGPDLGDVNFWRPSPGVAFRALRPGELFLFKLHAPEHFVVGGGFFAEYLRLPIHLAWDVFGSANGAGSAEEMRRRVRRYRREDVTVGSEVGCIVVTETFFLPEPEWIPAPPDFRPNIVQGKGYDVATPVGWSLYEAVADRLSRQAPVTEARHALVEGARRGRPVIVYPRLGQGAFRIMVGEAYQRRCVITGERTWPVLEAAHIRPFAQGGPHRVDNGLFLRSDLHRLFDSGYITVNPDDRRLVVSPRIREEFENGRDYYALQGRALSEPMMPRNAPSETFLEYHAEHIYRP